MKGKRAFALLLVLLIYAVAIGLGAVMFINIAPPLDNPLLAMLLCDLTVTVFIWVLSLLFRNTSLYDPYWSVIPPAMLAGWLLYAERALTAIDILLIIAVSVWALRLTINWAVQWKGLDHEDWRYGSFRSKKIFHLVNLFGFQLMPTFVVFVAMIPAYFTVAQRTSDTVNAGTVIGLILCLAAALLQLVADVQMIRFRKTNTDRKKVMDTGLWKYSRHPNYLGEIIMWWGVYIMSLGIGTPWFMFLGALPVTFLFILVSAPMMEEHLLKSRPAYAAYKKRVSMFIPLPNRKVEEPPKKGGGGVNNNNKNNTGNKKK